jgi:predicted solute-binding protein
MGLFGSKQKTEEKTLPVLPSEVHEWATMELADKIAPSAIEITPKSLRIGDKIVRTFFVISYPRYLTDNWFTPIINLDKIFDVAIYINPIETAELLKHFQKKIAEVESQIIVRQQKGLDREPLILFYYEELDYQEIAEVLKLPVSTVGVRLRRGRLALENLIKKYDPTYQHQQS